MQRLLDVLRKRGYSDRALKFLEDAYSELEEIKMNVDDFLRYRVAQNTNSSKPLPIAVVLADYLKNKRRRGVYFKKEPARHVLHCAALFHMDEWAEGCSLFNTHPVEILCGEVVRFGADSCCDWYDDAAIGYCRKHGLEAIQRVMLDIFYKRLTDKCGKGFEENRYVPSIFDKGVATPTFSPPETH